MSRSHFSEPDRLGGRHELGQNRLIDRRFPAVMTDLLRHAPPYPVLELGAGDGAVTAALVAVGRAVTAVEIDPHAAARLRRRFPAAVEVLTADLLGFDYGPRPHHVVSNVPFGITTPLLRGLLPGGHWHTAVLLVQWEVARKRAAVGGTTLLTAAWWPWYDFALAGRVPAAAFHPRPAVDGGLLVITRRDRPLLPTADRDSYQHLVREVFTGTGTGHGLGADLRRRLPTSAARGWLDRQGLSANTLPRDLTATHWASLHQVLNTATRPGRPGRRPDRAPTARGVRGRPSNSRPTL